MDSRPLALKTTRSADRLVSTQRTETRDSTRQRTGRAMLRQNAAFGRGSIIACAVGLMAWCGQPSGMMGRAQGVYRINQCCRVFGFDIGQNAVTQIEDMTRAVTVFSQNPGDLAPDGFR